MKVSEQQTIANHAAVDVVPVKTDGNIEFLTSHHPASVINRKNEIIVEINLSRSAAALVHMAKVPQAGGQFTASMRIFGRPHQPTHTLKRAELKGLDKCLSAFLKGTTTKVSEADKSAYQAVIAGIRRELAAAKS